MKYFVLILFLLHFQRPFLEGQQVEELFPDEINKSEWGNDKIQADEFFGASLFHEAIPCFQAVWERQKGGDFAEEDQIPLKLGYSCYMEKQFFEAAKVLQEYVSWKVKKGEEAPSLVLFLLGSSLRNLGEYQKAAEVLQASLGKREMGEEIRFELGLTYFLWGQVQAASRHFRQLSREAKDGWIAHASTLYLVRIALLEGEYTYAKQLFSRLDQATSDDAIQKEALYLKGELAYLLKDYEEAALYFENALPKRNEEKAPWLKETLYHLGWSYLKAATDLLTESALRESYFDRAEKSFKKLSTLSEDEKVFLALGQFYLSKAAVCKDPHGYQKAEEILSHREAFTTPEGKAQALFLRAEAAPSYMARDKFYAELTAAHQTQNGFYPRGWYLKGLNSLDYAATLLRDAKQLESATYFKQAAGELLQAFHLLKQQEKKQAGHAIKHYIRACYFQNQLKDRLAALAACDELIARYPDIVRELDHPEEIYYLKGFIAAQIGRLDLEPIYWDLACRTFQQELEIFPESFFQDSTLFLLGFLHHEKEHYEKAREYFVSLSEKCPRSSHADEALFLASIDSEKIGESGKSYLLQLLERYPHSPRAAEAYFSLYSFHDYLQGDKYALKHLQNFKNKYPHSPLLLNAYYLIGLDCKRDRRSDDGKWIRKKNLKESIDAFQEAERLFILLSDKISENQYTSYLTLYYRAKLERALANSTIAEASQGAKKAIYGEYAINVLQELIKEIEEKNHLAVLDPETPFPRFQEEYLFGLAQAYLKAGDTASADLELAKMVDKYRTAHVTRGYFLARVWYEKGLLAQKNNQFEDALRQFQLAEDAGKGKVLTSEQKLALWIEQSLCYRALHQYDHSMLVLSKVINSDVASGLRLKAMFLRAEIYELQGRHELAKKQLETIAKKGGDWSSKAIGKLEKEYGYE